MKKFKGLIWIFAVVMLFSIIAIGSGESSTNSEPKVKETPSRILSEADIEAHSGTYVGEDGCVLVFSKEGKVFYYCRSNDSVEKDLDWYVEDEKLTWHSEKLDCDIYASELMNEGNVIRFASNSLNWRDETYKKVSTECETPSIEDCKKLIVTVYPDALGVGSPEKTSENQVQMPKCSEAFAKRTYDYAQELFVKAGFTNVSAEGKGDLIIAILHSEGDIDKITVDGKQTVLTEGLWLDKDTPILISAHSKEKWGPTKASGTQSEPIQTSGQEQPIATEAPKPTQTATSAPVTSAPTAKPTQAPTATPKPTAVPTQAPTPNPTPTKVPTPQYSYWSGKSGKPSDGDSGIYSYVRTGTVYDNYVIIDFENNYVYFFADRDGNTRGERLMIEGGSLNKNIVLTYHMGGETWQVALHFKYAKMPNILCYEDGSPYSTEFVQTDLAKAIELLKTKKITAY